jgi:hypothetical protein
MPLLQKANIQTISFGGNLPGFGFCAKLYLLAEDLNASENGYYL